MVDRNIFDALLETLPRGLILNGRKYKEFYEEIEFFGPRLMKYDPRITREDKDTNCNLKYTLNQYNFRKLDDNPSETSIVALGCSDTFGIGNLLEDTWAYKLGKKLNQPVWNLGHPGGGIDICYLNLKTISQNIKFDKVFFLVPSAERTFLFFDHYDDNESSEIHLCTGNFTSLPNLKFKHTHISPEEYSLRLALNSENIFSKIMVAVDGIENICRKNNAELFFLFNPPFYHDEVSDKILKSSIRDKSLDGMHLGPKFQNLIYEQFFLQYKKRKHIAEKG